VPLVVQGKTLHAATLVWGNPGVVQHPSSYESMGPEDNWGVWGCSCKIEKVTGTGVKNIR